MLKATSTKHNKYAVNQKLEYFDDISVRNIFAGIRVVLLQNIVKLDS